ncbi:hypothetical protein [Parasitella parasitica]|uniref:Uncharacterized protein n=1 Tax=Parasitella parasitica TaxID=35722 RepID=A0A0B7N5F5_9FUNG|nr:hypothetical protein [Parasitella parasitica]
MASYSTKAVQNQSAFGSSGPPPMHINDATHVSSLSIPSNTNDAFDMSTSTSFEASSTASFSSIVALKGKYSKTLSNFNTLTNKESMDIAYLITTDKHRNFMSEIKTLKFDVLKTRITTIGCPNCLIVPINIEKCKLPWCLLRRHTFNDVLVIEAHRLPIAVQRERIISFRLFTALDRWYADIVSARGIITWSGFREELIMKCGKSSTDIREHAGKEFGKLRYQPKQPPDVLFGKFQSLRKQAQTNEQEF